MYFTRTCLPLVTDAPVPSVMFTTYRPELVRVELLTRLLRCK